MATVTFGQFAGGFIDLSDLEAFPVDGSARTKYSAFYHELYEQYLKQYAGRDYKEAHPRAITQEEILTGNKLVDNKIVSNGDVTYTVISKYIDKDGKFTIQIVISSQRIDAVRVITGKPQ